MVFRKNISYEGEATMKKFEGTQIKIGDENTIIGLVGASGHSKSCLFRESDQSSRRLEGDLVLIDSDRSRKNYLEGMGLKKSLGPEWKKSS